MSDPRDPDPFRTDFGRLIDSQQGPLRIAARIIAIACICMGTMAYIGHERLGDVAGHPVFISPYFALVMILCGIALHAARAYPRHAPLIGIAMIGMLAWTAIAPHWFDAWMNGRTVSAAFATALGLLGAVVALSLRHNKVRRPPSARPSLWASLSALLGIALSTLIAYGLIENDIVSRQRFANESATTIAHKIDGKIAQTIALVGRQAKRWKAVDHVPSPAFIREEFNSYLRDFPFFDGFALLDADQSMAMALNREGTSPDWVKDLIESGGLRGIISHVIESDEPHIVIDDRLSRNRHIGLIITPQSNPAMKEWFTITRFNLSNVFTQATAGSRHGYFSITHDGHTLYRSADTHPRDIYAAGELAIPIHHDLDLKLEYAYAKAPGDIRADLLPEFVLLAGVLFTFLLISSQRLARIARESSAQLTHSALHDPLTGLPNRRMLEQTLRDACIRARTEKSSVSVVFLDLDGIKLINDSMGHRIGDEVLMEVSDRLLNGVQLDGSVTRLGGDEFVLLFLGLELRQVQERTQHIMHELAKPYFVTSKALRVTASAGITISDGHTRDHMQLVREADLAMLKAKQEGRNTWHTYTEDLSARVADRLELRNDLQSALDADALELHYQPIIAGHSGRVVGVEALVRWQHPTRGYISPSRFIPLSEETGQIAPLTEWVLATACRDSDALRKKGFSALPVIINISPLYFQRTDFVQKIRKALGDAELPASLLEIEITEGVLLDNEEAAILKLTQLRDMGIQTSIDDFGTGYSSLNYLKNLPINKVKIDRSFVTDVVSDPADAAIAQGIVSMAHHLGLKVIAEGVETESQLAFLKRNHCDEYQGYLFARPMPFSELVAKLSENSGHFIPQPLDTESSERVLLLVDDEQNILNALTRLLRRDGYRILTANNAPQALELLAKHQVQVIVSDQRMPEMTGTEFFGKVKEMYPTTMRMILSGYTDLKSVTEAINHGAIYKFITKPWDDESLRKDIEQAFINQRSRDVQEILNSERERLRQLFQLAPGFVCILNGPRHVFELANDAYYQLIGHRKILGLGVAEALPEVVEQGYLEKLDRVYSTGKPFISHALPLQIQRSVGAPFEQRYIDLVYQPIRGADGRVTGIFAQGHDVTETRQLAQEISYRTMHDDLTGLYNRHEFERKGRQLESLAGSHALLHIDLDHFKLVNDKGGYAAGDELLRRIAVILRQHAGENDLLARLSSDEYGLMLVGASRRGAMERALALCDKVRNHSFTVGGHCYQSTLSIGLVEFGADPALSFSKALGMASIACFLAKEKGRNRVQISHPGDPEIFQWQIDMDRVALIKECIRENRIVLYEQRFAALHARRHGDMQCSDVLVRMLDAEGNLLMPQVFLPAAERFGLMEELDHQVIHAAFSKIHALPADTRDKNRYFIHVSEATLHNPDFAARIEHILEQHANVRPRHVCFEVAEAAATTNLAHTASIFRFLSERGFSVALGRFNSGLSSLSDLQRLSVHYIKIDGDLVKGLLTEPTGGDYVKAVVKVARAMGIMTVAESVEFPWLLRQLQKLDLDYGLGFALYRPEPL